MLLELIFCRKVALLLLISPGMTMSFGPGLEALVYSTPLSIALSAAAFARCDTPLPAVGEGLDSSPQVGGFCAHAAGSAASKDVSARILIRPVRYMCALPQCQRLYPGLMALLLCGNNHCTAEPPAGQPAAAAVVL